MYQQSVTAASFPRYSPSFPRRRETTGWQGDAGEQDNTNQYPSPLMTEDQSLSQCLTLGAEGEINTPTHVTDCTCTTQSNHPYPTPPPTNYPFTSLSIDVYLRRNTPQLQSHPSTKFKQRIHHPSSTRRCKQDAVSNTE